MPEIKAFTTRPSDDGWTAVVYGGEAVALVRHKDIALSVCILLNNISMVMFPVEKSNGDPK